MSRSRTPVVPSRVEARRRKTVRTRIVLSVTAAAAVVAVGVAVADSDGEGHRDARADGATGAVSKTAGAGAGSPAATTTPAQASPGPTASATGSPAPATPSAAQSSASTEPETPKTEKVTPKPKPKPAGTTAGGSGGTGGSGGSGGTGGSGTADSGTESAVLALVNKERAAAGCGPLATDSALTAAARAYSDTMARSGVMSHTGPDGSTMTSRVEAAGYGWSRLGENIARGQADADAVMNSWMNSPGHRANILNCAFTEIGIGVHKGDGGPWWTQDFGTPR
ncbi:CAP domain-containing protein [Streptomyces sp. NPDC046161]|uniref:CAP domain-containing protein n=1 Tax=Streptomyces sp. NPDC046161 TaxID=3155132 RepID=UPI0033C542C8